MWTTVTPAAEVVARVVLVYVLLLVLVRLAGKREIGELSPMEFLAMLLLSETVSPALTGGDDSLPSAGIAATALIAVTVLVNGLAFRFPWFERLSEGRPALLIRAGRVNGRVMRTERITPRELRATLRREGVESPEEVEKAYVETSGKITVIKGSGARAKRSRSSSPD
jgi:uncharacterized membrane protein YcaP (DUF421 family)